MRGHTHGGGGGGWSREASPQGRAADPDTWGALPGCEACDSQTHRSLALVFVSGAVREPASTPGFNAAGKAHGLFLTEGQADLGRVLSQLAHGHRGAVGHPPKGNGNTFCLHREELERVSIITPYAMSLGEYKQLVRGVCSNRNVCTFITLGGRPFWRP